MKGGGVFIRFWLWLTIHRYLFIFSQPSSTKQWFMIFKEHKTAIIQQFDHTNVTLENPLII